MRLRSALAAAILLAGLPQPGLAGTPAAPAEAEERPTWVQFRDLFDRKGKPTDLAVDLSGQLIEIVGFQTPSPTRASPFMVMVGRPTAVCPYCTAINDEEHLPYVLVYPHFEGQIPRFRGRLRIIGRIQASHAHEAFYGLHNDVRVLDARILVDQPGRDGARAELQPVTAAEGGGGHRRPTTFLDPSEE